MDAIEFLTDALVQQGVRQYGMEPVSQLEHALQCAALAEDDGAPSALIVAALLHDIGHMLHGLDPHAGRRGVDDRHEVTGAALVGRWFGPDVSEPVRFHVAAKRYLCAVEPGYHDTLSPASRRTLEQQGRAFTAEAAQGFIVQRYANDAVRLRRWDDRAKVAGRNDIPRLSHYRIHLRRSLAPAAANVL